MRATARAIIRVRDKTAIVEGSPQFVDAQVAKYISGAGPSDSSSHSQSPVLFSESEIDSPPIEKQLVLVKRPAGHAETVAVLAFALAQTGTLEFTEEDMRQAYLRAGVRPPKVVAQAIRDAKNVFGYVDTGSKRGRYKLAHHGERTVRFDLPRKNEKG
jgi:hypothetical protein